MKTKTLSIRVDEKLSAELQAFEDKTGIERASLVRAAIKAVLDHFKEADSIVFPLEVIDSRAGKRGDLN